MPPSEVDIKITVAHNHERMKVDGYEPYGSLLEQTTSERRPVNFVTDVTEVSTLRTQKDEPSPVSGFNTIETDAQRQQEQAFSEIDYQALSVLLEENSADSPTILPNAEPQRTCQFSLRLQSLTTTSQLLRDDDDDCEDEDAGSGSLGAKPGSAQGPGTLEAISTAEGRCVSKVHPSIETEQIDLPAHSEGCVVLDGEFLIESGGVEKDGVYVGSEINTKEEVSLSKVVKSDPIHVISIWDHDAWMKKRRAFSRLNNTTKY